MSGVKIAFWGLGSIAKRHIRNLKAVLEPRGEGFIIDVYRHRAQEITEHDIKELIHNSFVADEWGRETYDYVFITNPTALHYETIRKCAPQARALFIEKPVFDGVGYDVRALAIPEHVQCYVACPLRYNRVLQYVKSNIPADEVISVRAISSSYLPDWRPGTDYRKTYSARAEMGGGVAIDLIHEWDYLTFLFGMPKGVSYIGGTFSKLDINSDDLAVYIAGYEDKVVELHLDYFGRSSERLLRLYTNDDVIDADILNGCIRWKKSGETVALPGERDDAQKRELSHFIDIVDGKIANDSTISHAVKVLKLAKGCSA